MKKVSALTLVYLVTSIGLHLLLRSKGRGEPFAISHRGAAGVAPENTIDSVQKAIEQGATHVEVDVQRTADGVLVLHHDAAVELARGGKRQIGALQWEEVRGEQVRPPMASFEQFLEAVAATRVVPIVELKNPGKYPGIEADVVALLAAHRLRERAIVVSFADESLRKVREIDPRITVGQIQVQSLYVTRVEGAASVAVFWLFPLLDPTFVWRQHRAGQQAWVWTVDSPAVMRLLLAIGVDGITTNYPRRWPGANQGRVPK